MQTQTTTTPKTVKEAAAMLYHALIQDKRNDGSEFYKLADGSPAWMTEVIHDVHGRDSISPDDTIYEFINRAAGAFSDSDAETDNEYSEVISEMGADINTHELTSWLHERPDHLAYCDDASKEWGPFESISDLLMAGQKMHIEEVAYALLSALSDFVEALPEEEDESEEEEINFATWWDLLRSQTFDETLTSHFTTVPGWIVDPVDIDYWAWLDDNTYSRE